MEQFTANEVRTESCKQGQLHRQPASDMLNAFADMLEAREIARNDAIEREYERENNPASSDAEGLAEALQPFANLLQPHHASIPDDRPIYGINKAEITAGDLRRANEALAAHSAQAQPPAARVTVDAVMRVIDGQRRFPYCSIDEKQAFSNGEILKCIVMLRKKAEIAFLKIIIYELQL